MSNKGVKFRKSPEGITTFTIEMDEFLKENYLKMPLKTMGKSIGKSDVGVRKRLSQLGLIIPPELIQKRVLDSRLKKGIYLLIKEKNGMNIFQKIFRNDVEKVLLKRTDTSK